MTTPSRLPDDLKDTLAKEQWWLFNTGQRVENNYSVETKGTPDIDLNVLPLWPQYTGKGIKVGVIDNGIDGNHEDFAGNFNQSLSLPDSLGGAFPQDQNPKKPDNHGTAVAGIIGARRNNLVQWVWLMKQRSPVINLVAQPLPVYRRKRNSTFPTIAGALAITLVSIETTLQPSKTLSPKAAMG